MPMNMMSALMRPEGNDPTTTSTGSAAMKANSTANPMRNRRDSGATGARRAGIASIPHRVGGAVRLHRGAPRARRGRIVSFGPHQRAHHVHRHETSVEDDRRTRPGDLRPLSGGRRTGVRNRVTPTHCGRCGTELPADVLACPACGALVHAETLKRLAADAEAASRAGDFSAARDHWSAALHLLPPQSRQHAAVRERIVGLTRRTDTAQPKQTAAATEQPWRSRGAAGFAPPSMTHIARPDIRTA